MSHEFADRSGSKIVTAAVEFGSSCHEGQKRKTGEPYFDHCLAVAAIIRDEWLISDETLLSAALLHDTVEDTGITVEEIGQRFGRDIANLVEGVTKLSSSSGPISADRQTLRKVIDKSYLNPGVAIIKLADRLHNLRTISGLTPEKQQYKARETLEVYTRLAESLGMWEVKTELEDLAFAVVEPSAYAAIKKEVDADHRLDPNFLSYIQTSYQQLLSDNDISGTVNIRRAGYYALAKKREASALAGRSAPDNFTSINDLVSVRVQVPFLEDCYQIIHAIHNTRNSSGNVDYGRFDEFIGTNKRDNGYEAIQTTIDYPQGPIEIAVTTNEMEEFNRLGIISLLRSGQRDQIRNYSLKLVFTPTGSVRFLPRNATGVDLAYLINPQLGADAVGMMVDGRAQPLSAVVPNSSTVEILVGPPRRAQEIAIFPYCSMPSTRAEFTRQQKLQEKDELINRGLEIMSEILAPRGFLVLTDIGDSINAMLFKLGCSQPADLYVKVGGKFITPQMISAELDIAGITKDRLRISTIRVRGADGPGLLYDITGLIKKTGRNIEMANMQKRGEEMDLRLLVKYLSPAEEESLRQALRSDNRFSECLVV